MQVASIHIDVDTRGLLVKSILNVGGTVSICPATSARPTTLRHPKWMSQLKLSTLALFAQAINKHFSVRTVKAGKVVPRWKDSVIIFIVLGFRRTPLEEQVHVELDAIVGAKLSERTYSSFPCMKERQRMILSLATPILRIETPLGKYAQVCKLDAGARITRARGTRPCDSRFRGSD